MVTPKKTIKKVAPRRTTQVVLTSTEREKIFDKEEKLAERAGNAEERFMRDVSNAIDSCRSSQKIARLQKLWDDTSAKINKMITTAGAKGRKVTGKPEIKAIKVAEIQIESLEKQIELYNTGIRRVEELTK
jgi:hypothetical protein